MRVAIVGDILHSRVAHVPRFLPSIPWASPKSGSSPRTLLPVEARSLGVHIYHDMDEGIRDVDVVIMLRLQKERMQGAMLPSEHEYYRLFGLTEARLAVADSEAIVMHPGPINRGVEMASEVADGSRSVILQQVSYGIAVRMAVISIIIGTQNQQSQDNKG
ncbi:hypothetical protein [endosymbiont of Lamellibrachia barhami]|uniref:hypothetical protein n=1 Tax=endosymbiont of Lamellibrachia barhami TaxID=205975 RepID=UPI0015B14360|nr:hypothetical protein [endosymbiont of Lamellibrachia barhami]